MKMKQRQHRGMTSALAMIYLTVIAMLSVGFYTAVDLGSSVADNEQNINRSATASEIGLAFARYQLTSPQLTIPGPYSSTNLVSLVETQIANNLSGTANMGGANPTTQPVGSATALYIPGIANGSQGWMSTDSSGGQVQLTVTPTTVGNATNLVVTAVARNSNSRVTPITRSEQLTLLGSASNFSYGLVSYGQISLSGGVTVKGTNSGVIAVVPSGTKPISVVGNNTFAGPFYWTNNTAINKITWGNLQIEGFLSSSGSFKNVALPNTATPAAPVFDTSGFVQYVNSTTYGNGPLTTTSKVNGISMTSVTALTNASLAAGTYTFSNPITINGILYLQAGASVTFAKAVTLNGCIVEANQTGENGGVTTPSLNIAFDGALTQSAMSAATLGVYYTAAEAGLSGTALLLPNYNVTFNGTVTTNAGSIIGGNMTFNSGVSVTVTNGSVMNMGGSGITFNSNATLNVNTASTTPSGTKLTFTANPATYAEVHP
jgi:Tfp pilus assembly protein PilX